MRFALVLLLPLAACSEPPSGVDYMGAGDAPAAQYAETLRAVGDPDSLAELGWMYVVAEGVPEDHAEARRILEPLAAQGHARAAYYLGAMHASAGEFAPARQWMHQAAAAGADDAERLLAGIPAE